MNPLFPVNYMDREFRKDMASHARETIQFSRNVNEGMLRMSLYMFDHNFFKSYRMAHKEKRHLRHAEVTRLDRDYLEEGPPHGEISSKDPEPRVDNSIEEKERSGEKAPDGLRGRQVGLTL